MGGEDKEKEKNEKVREREEDITSRYDRKFTGLLEIYGVDDDARRDRWISRDIRPYMVY